MEQAALAVRIDNLSHADNRSEPKGIRGRAKHTAFKHEGAGDFVLALRHSGAGVDRECATESIARRQLVPVPILDGLEPGGNRAGPRLADREGERREVHHVRSLW